MKNELEKILRSAIGERAKISRMSAVSGGCIAEAQHIVLNDGQQLFVKSVPQSNVPQSALEAEAFGLRAIAQTNTLSVPEVILCGKEGEQEFLVLEWIDQGPKPRNFFSELGAGLACLHKSDSTDHAGVGFGWKQDNFLGSSLQPNQSTTDWCQFFA
ncbi:MAG: fructosamine kinase family protein, partial [Planctomycetota bacterium]